MRKQIVAGNWKMNTTAEEAKSLTNGIIEGLSNLSLGGKEVILSPPFVHLSEVRSLVDNSEGVYVSAQNCHQASSGAFTGEVSAPMLKSMDVGYVILGHSERRTYFGETDALLAEKVVAALDSNLTPIFCIGETLEERESGQYQEVIKRQLTEGLFHLSEDSFSGIILAYEPVWAIGTGLTAEPHQAQEVHAFIRALLSEQYSQEIANKTTILYGGSCKPGNAESLFSQPDVDGGLIGGASLKADDFLAIIQAL